MEGKLLAALGDAHAWVSLTSSERLVEVPEESKLFEELHKLLEETMADNLKLNNLVPIQSDIREQLKRLWRIEVDESVAMHTPFHTDFGRHTIVGKHVFINKDAMFTDLGGIVLEDHVLIGPRCSLITVNHYIDPVKRRGLQLSPIRIKKNAWLGANVTVLPGVTIGENAVVGANSTVTKDVPDNAVVVGSPARVVKTIV